MKVLTSSLIGSGNGLTNLKVIQPITFTIGLGANLANGTNLTTVGGISAGAGTIWKWKAIAKTNPAGGGFTFDIKKNGSTVFSSPIVVAADTTAIQSGSSFSLTTCAENDEFTIDITGVGTGVQSVNITLYLMVSGL